MVFQFMIPCSAFICADYLVEIKKLEDLKILTNISSYFFIFLGLFLLFFQIKYSETSMLILGSIFLTQIIFSFIENYGLGYIFFHKISSKEKEKAEMLLKILNQNMVLIILFIMVFSFIFLQLIHKILKIKGLYAFIYNSAVSFTENRIYSLFHFFEIKQIYFRFSIYLLIFSISFFSFIKNLPFSYVTTFTVSSICLILLGVELLFDYNWNLCVNICSGYQKFPRKYEFHYFPFILWSALVIIFISIRMLILKKNTSKKYKEMLVY